MTLREVANTVQGFHRRQEEHIRAQWESSRFVIMNLLTPHLKKGRILKPKDIAIFPWEKSTEKVDVEATRKRGLELAKKWAKNG